LSTPELQKSIRKREKTEKKIAIAASRCFTIHWRSGLRASWDLEIAVNADGFPDVATTPEAATKLCDSLVEFLIAVAAGAMGGGIDFNANSPPPPPPLSIGKSSGGGGDISPKSGGIFSPKNSKKGAAEESQFTFRERRLSITEDETAELVSDDMLKDEDGELYLAKEMDNKLTIVNTAADGPDEEIPFNSSLCGTYSCHGIEQKFSRAGVQVKAKINQDRGGIQHPFGGRKDMAFFCVMDGHGRGGEKISEYCISNLPKLLAQHPSLLSNPGLALKESVVDVDNDLRKFLSRESTFAGTTCICVLAVGDTLVIANAGDSRAVLGMVDPTSANRVIAKDLSFDHKPDSPAEATRVRAMGGFVSLGSPERGPSRVWLNKAMNSCGLAMARSLGDHALANVGVISEPEITVHTLGPHDRSVVVHQQRSETYFKSHF
jgi:serine/threonine protein phosphatase PrpC